MMPDDSSIVAVDGKSSRALEGTVVLELGMVMQVPLAGQMLGDHGADVIKVERPQGDILRSLDSHASEVGGMSAYYAAICRNKKNLCLDIKSDAGREILLRLVDRADVLIHNFRPGVMERLGYGYSELSARNPRLIYAAGSGFGQSGPLATFPGQDMLAQAISGFALSGAKADGAPRLTNTPVVDYGAASSLVQGILVALMERNRSGLGQLVTTSLFDVALAMQLNEIASITMYDKRTDWLKEGMLFQTADGWVLVVMLFRDNPLQRLCRAIGADDISARSGMQTRRQQHENVDLIMNELRPVFLLMPTVVAMQRLSEADLLCAPVNALEDSLDHSQAVWNECLWEVDVPGRGPVRLAGNPVHLSRTPAQLYRAPAELGADSDAVLAELGLSPEEIGAARRSGALGQAPGAVEQHKNGEPA